MDAINSLTADANKELLRLVGRVDADLRPLQRAYFKCCFGCSDDARPTAEVAPCLARCQEPMAAVQEDLGGVQATFQTRLKRCHALAAEALPAELSRGGAGARAPSEAEMGVYAARLAPCFREEMGKLPALVAPLTAAVPRARAAIEVATPAAAAAIDKKGWW
jgi:hypothetical protein